VGQAGSKSGESKEVMTVSKKGEDKMAKQDYVGALDVHPLDVHPYAPEWHSRKNRDSSASYKEAGSFKFSISDSPKEISLSNDVWVSGKWGKASIGSRPLGGKYAGQMSPILGDGTVIDHHGHSIGRIDGNGYFNTRLF
jgi:hypothetical protein